MLTTSYKIDLAIVLSNTVLYCVFRPFHNFFTKIMFGAGNYKCKSHSRPFFFSWSWTNKNQSCWWLNWWLWQNKICDDCSFPVCFWESPPRKCGNHGKAIHTKHNLISPKGRFGTLTISSWLQWSPSLTTRQSWGSYTCPLDLS